MDVIREELIVSPKEYDPIVAMSPARVIPETITSL